MAKRSRAREVALQLLFQRDHNPSVARAARERFVHDRLRDAALEAFCLSLHDGVVTHLGDIDARITAAADSPCPAPATAGVPTCTFIPRTATAPTRRPSLSIWSAAAAWRRSPLPITTRSAASRSHRRRPLARAWRLSPAWKLPPSTANGT